MMNNQPTPQEKPLLFTPDNRAAVRLGIKTETRRLMKPQPHFGKEMGNDPAALLSGATPMLRQNYGYVQLTNGHEFGPMRSPYGCPQQNPVRYWVREPVQVLSIDNRDMDSINAHIQYCDDITVSTTAITESDYQKLSTGKPLEQRSTHPRFMFKSFTRTWLKGVSVHPEQLGDITPEDAIAEGIELDPDVVINISDVDERLTWAYSQTWRDYLNGGYDLDPVQSYVSLWQSIHGEDAWDPRQWVWVVRFEIQG